MSKWTKEQIAFARSILRNHGCGSEEDACSCAFCHNSAICPFLVGEGIGPSYEKFSGAHAQLIKKLIAQHEHDADIVPPEGYSGVTISAEGQNIPSPANMPVHDYWRYKFAGMAMQGILSNAALENWSQEVFDKNCKINGMSDEETANRWISVTAQCATAYADELLKQLEGGK